MSSQFLPWGCSVQQQRLPWGACQLLEDGEQAVNAGGPDTDQVHGAGEFAQSVQGDLFSGGVGVVDLAERLHQFRQAHDLHSMELSKSLIPVINGQADIGVLLEADELFASLAEHPEAVVMPAVFDGGYSAHSPRSPWPGHRYCWTGYSPLPWPAACLTPV